MVMEVPAMWLKTVALVLALANRFLMTSNCALLPTVSHFRIMVSDPRLKARPLSPVVTVA